MRRLYALVEACVEHKEPALLIGETGCGEDNCGADPSNDSWTEVARAELSPTHGNC